MLDTVSAVADEVFIPLTVGGGIRTRRTSRRRPSGRGQSLHQLRRHREPRPHHRGGARSFGNQCIVISVDSKRRFDEQGEHYVEVDGESCWFECTVKGGREGTDLDVVEWAKEAEERGAGELFVNSIDADGTKDGYDIPLTKAVCDAVSTPVIASSGCGGPEDAYEGCSPTRAPTPRWPPASSTSTSTPSAKSRNISTRRGCRFGYSRPSGARPLFRPRFSTSGSPQRTE